MTGLWVDQHGLVTRHVAGRTFPPCIGRKGERAYRHLVDEHDLVEQAVAAA